MTIRKKWFLIIVLLVGVFGAAETVLSRAIILYGADQGAQHWFVGNAYNARVQYHNRIFAELEREARRLAKTQEVQEALHSGSADHVQAVFSAQLVLPQDGFLMAFDARGRLLAGDAECAVDARARTPGHSFVLCGTTLAMLGVITIGDPVVNGVIVAGRRLGAEYLKLLSKITGTQVVLWGQPGELAGSARDLQEQPLALLPNAALTARLNAFGGSHFGVYELSFPRPFIGYSQDGQHVIAAGAQKLKAYVFTSPLDPSRAVLGTVLYWAPVEVTRLGADYATAFMGIGTLALLIVSLVIAQRLVAQLARPLSELGAGAQRIASGDFSVLLPVDGEREVAELATAFNSMVDGLRTNKQQLLQSEKMAAVGQLAGGIAHEINNPLGVILGFSEMIEADLSIEHPAHESITIVVREARRCRNLVSELLTFSRTEVKRGETTLAETVGEMAPLIEARGKMQKVGLVLELSPKLPPLLANRTQLQQVLINLATNALDAMPQGGTLSVRTRSAQSTQVLEVEDTGTGIPESVRSRIFEPFFTTKDVGQGTGLGLSLVYEIVRRHGGNIDVTSTMGRGSRFTVTLPA